MEERSIHQLQSLVLEEDDVNFGFLLLHFPFLDGEVHTLPLNTKSKNKSDGVEKKKHQRVTQR